MEGSELEESGAAEDVVESPVLRDGPLPRFAADRAVPAFLGRDFELAFLTYTTRLEAEFSRRTDGGVEQQGMRLNGELLELARMRMPPAGAIGLAFAILQQALENSLVEDDKMRTDLENMLSMQTAARGGATT